MKNGLFIAGDWGTSRLRLYLCEGAKVLHRKEGKGIGSGAGEAGDAKGAKTEDLGTYLFGLIGDWLEERGRLPIYLSGMVGSSIGWRITPYVECPASKEALSSSLTYFVYEGCDVYLVSGLACTNFLGARDFVRGEETEILGALSIWADLGKGEQVLCLPGTHTKWILVGRWGGKNVSYNFDR